MRKKIGYVLGTLIAVMNIYFWWTMYGFSGAIFLFVICVLLLFLLAWWLA